MATKGNRLGTTALYDERNGLLMIFIIKLFYLFLLSEKESNAVIRAGMVH